MTPADDIPEEIRRFIGEYIDDVPQLETLLMMNEEQDRAWLVSEVAARNYTTDQRALETLDALRRRGLLSRDDSPAHFRFTPATPQTRALVAEVGQYYRKNLARIATYIHSKPSASIKEFARAFELKKDR
ncbi:MAG TPA: hypothetical protein VJP84_11940 [Steroidobacteraceae bacterium]|jgi:DNA-binding MarR family transcriptional regulator|nr:hypothetical protein [Steroidobacteraceae bacterium]